MAPTVSWEKTDFSSCERSRQDFIGRQAPWGDNFNLLTVHQSLHVIKTTASDDANCRYFS